MTTEPFRSSPDPEVFFETPGIGAIVSRLVSALDGGEPLSLLTGEPGTGKTTVLHRVMAATRCQPFVSSVAMDLGDLHARLPRAEAGRRVAVGLDEAQALSRDLLLALPALLAARPDLRIVLAGQPAIEGKLAALEARGVALPLSIRCRLAPLAAGDVGAYLAYRWSHASSQPSPFGPAAVARIAELSQGVPQVVNLIAVRALHLAERRGHAAITQALVEAVALDLGPARSRRSSSADAHRKGWRVPRRALVAAAFVPLVISASFALRPARDPEPVDPPMRREVILPRVDRIALLSSPGEPGPAAPPASSVAPPALPTVPAGAPASPAPSSTTSTRAPAGAPVFGAALPGGSAPAGPPAGPAARAAPTSSAGSSTAVAAPAPPPDHAPTTTALALPPRPRPAPAPVGVIPREPAKDEALIRRAEDGDVQAVRALLAEGASPAAQDASGFTPLMLAVIHDHPAVVDLLLTRGAAVNAHNRAGLTPLMLAAINDHPAVLRTLIDRGADMNARTRAGWTALTYASWRGYPDVVRLLLARGADPNVVDREGWTVLQYVTWRAGQPRVSEDDMPGGLAVLNGPGAAVQPRHAEVIALLRQAGARR